MPTNTKLTGHSLREKGAPFSWDENRQQWLRVIGADFNIGVGLCSCGETSETLRADRHRREWHRKHKQDVVAAQSLDALKTAYPDENWDEDQEDEERYIADVCWEVNFYPYPHLVVDEEQQEALLTAISDAVMSPHSWISVRWGDVMLVMHSRNDRTRVIFTVSAESGRSMESFQDDVAVLLASLKVEGDLYVNRVVTVMKET